MTQGIDRYVLVKNKSAFSDSHAKPTLTDFNELTLSGFSDPVSRNPIVEEAIDQPSVASMAGGLFKASGTLDGSLRPIMLAELLHSMFGNRESGVSHAGIAKRGIGGVDGLTFTPYYIYTLGNIPGVFDMILGDDQAMKNTLYVNCAVSSMDITCETAQFVKAKFNWMASKAYTGSDIDEVTYTAATNTESPLVFYNMAVLVGGVSIVAKSMTLNITRKFDEQFAYLGSPFIRGHWLNGLTTITGTFTFGSNQWTQIEQVMRGGNLESTGGLQAKSNDLGCGTLAMYLYGPTASGPALSGTPAINEAQLAIISGTDALKFTEMNRSVQARNQFEKTVNFQVITPSADSFYLLTN